MLNTKVNFCYNDIVTILRKSLVFTFIFIMVELFSIVGIYTDTVNEHIKKIDVLYQTEGKDLSLLCNAISCKGVVDNTTHYTNVDGILVRDNFNTVDIIKTYSQLNKDLDTVIYKDGTYFVIDNSNAIDFIYRITWISTIALYLIMLLMSFNIRKTEMKRDLFEKAVLKNSLETRLQRDITESLHHEMGTPLAIIRSLVNELFKLLYPCEITQSNMCDLKIKHKDIPECNTCISNTRRREMDGKALMYYEQLTLAGDSLFALQTLIGKGKHINYSNGTVSVFEIVNNVISSSNGFRVRKITPHYFNKDILDNYSCKTLANGELLIVINTMIINAIEAKATAIEVRGELDEDKLNLYITDNGRGIRDKHDRPVTDLNIFNYGYSTKNMVGENIQIKGLFRSILVKLGIVTHSNQERGAGLSISKRILLKSGGDIVLTKTDTNGTTFKVTIPTKPREKSVIKSQYS